MRRALTVAAVLLCALPARAQEVGWALPRLTPGPLAHDGLHAERATGLPHLAFGATATFDFAHRPLVHTRAEHGVGVANRDVVTGQLFATPSLALGLLDRVTVYAALPIAVHQNGAGYDGTVPGRKRFAIGDARVGARLTLSTSSFSRVAVAADVFAPTGERLSWSGDESFRGRVAGLLEVTPSATTYFLVNAGVMVRPQRRALDMRSGTEASVVLAGGIVEGDLRLGLEVAAATGLTGTTFARAQTTPIELLAVATYKLGGFYLTPGGGLGLTNAAGTPEFRGVLRLGYAPDPKPTPKPPPPKKPDSDDDGVDDAVDACPALKGKESVDPAMNGCPDKDGDGIADPDDACVDVAGAKSADKATNGCPVKTRSDRDKDGIFDDEDACPDQPGDYSEDAKLNGCPAPPAEAQ